MRDDSPVRSRLSPEEGRGGGLGTVGLRGFDRSLPMALLRAREAVMSGFRERLGRHGVTEQQWRVLRALEHGGGTMSVGALVDATLLLGPSLSRMVASMAERDLVTRAPATDDARRVEVAITDRGRALVAEIAPESEAWYDRIEDHVGSDDLDELHRLLDRLAELAVDPLDRAHVTPEEGGT